MNHTELDPSTEVGLAKPIEKHYYDFHAPSRKRKSSKTSFQYYSYIPSFKEFMESVKKLEVGREIKIGDIIKILPKEEIPEDLKEYCWEEDKSINKNSDYIRYHVDTVALNVDEMI